MCSVSLIRLHRYYRLSDITDITYCLYHSHMLPIISIRYNMCHLHTVYKLKLDSILFIITTKISLNTICTVCNYLIFYNIKWQFYYYQELLDFRRDEGDPQDVSTAVFYSISATQKGTAICMHVDMYAYIKAYCVWK